MHTPQAEPAFACEDCAKCFNSSTGLANHRDQIHSHERPFACERCPNRFAKRHLLNRHVSDSHQNQLYPCSQCFVILSTECNLKRHVAAMHTKAKPYGCDKCEQKFERKYVMKNHRAKCRA
eukprot:95018_1